MKKFKAFTLAEILIVFVIIGIIATVGVNTVKPWEKALKYSYSRIYNALALATYNAVVNGPRAEHSFPDGLAGSTTENQGPEKFCQDLAYFMNNVETHCGNPPITKAEGNYKVFDTTTPHIILSNGVKLWIGAPNSNHAYIQEIPLDNNKNSLKDTIIYYIVYADLTGDRKPNSPIWSERKAADVVAFAVTNHFVVVPLGYPVVDKRYLVAHVMRPISNEETGDDEEIPTDPMSFYEAATYAYGKYMKSQGDPLSYQLEFNQKIFSGTAQAQFFVVQNCNRISGDTGEFCTKNGSVKYFAHQPKFDSEASSFCGITNCGGADGSSTKYCEPICRVKIYDYH